MDLHTITNYKPPRVITRQTFFLPVGNLVLELEEENRTRL